MLKLIESGEIKSVGVSTKKAAGAYTEGTEELDGGYVDLIRYVPNRRAAFSAATRRLKRYC